MKNKVQKVDELRECYRCNIIKPLTLKYYMQRKRTYKGKTNITWYRYCRCCYNKRVLPANKKYKSKNRKKIAAKQRTYYQNNKPACKARSKKWYLDNKEICIENAGNSISNHRKNDVMFRIKGSISNRIKKTIGDKKNNEPCLNYLPFTLDELKVHLESLFEPWMNWDNYGKYYISSWDDNDQSTWKWNLDHLIPHCLFPYKTMKSKLFKKCWALSNLRPYNAKQNTVENDRLQSKKKNRLKYE